MQTIPADSAAGIMETLLSEGLISKQELEDITYKGVISDNLRERYAEKRYMLMTQQAKNPKEKTQKLAADLTLQGLVKMALPRLTQQRVDHDERFRQERGLTPARGYSYIDRPVIPTRSGRGYINGVPTDQALVDIKRRNAENARIDSTLRTPPKQYPQGHVFHNPGPRTDQPIPDRLTYHATGEDRSVWAQDLKDQLEMQARGKADPVWLKANEAAYQQRFGNLTQAEMQARARAIPGYLDANRKVYANRFGQPTTQGLVSPLTAP